MTAHFFGDTAVLTERSLRHITRSLDAIITTTTMPIAFMLLHRCRARRPPHGLPLGGGSAGVARDRWLPDLVRLALTWIAVRDLFSQRPVGTDIWIALAWCVGILVVAYIFAMVTYHRRIS